MVIQPFQLMDGGRVYQAKELMFLRLGLPVLTPLIPADSEVQILDEYFV
jgi:hypothetical protein